MSRQKTATCRAAETRRKSWRGSSMDAVPCRVRVAPKTKTAGEESDPVCDEGTQASEKTAVRRRKDPWPEQPGDRVKCADGDAEAGGNGGHPGEKYCAGAHGERREHEDIEAGWEDGVPAEHGEEADDEHGGG